MKLNQGPRGGVILTTASIAGLMSDCASGGGPPAYISAGYAASKRGLIAATELAACELAPHLIRCNAVAPGEAVLRRGRLPGIGAVSSTQRPTQASSRCCPRLALPCPAPPAGYVATPMVGEVLCGDADAPQAGALSSALACVPTGGAAQRWQRAPSSCGLACITQRRVTPPCCVCRLPPLLRRRCGGGAGPDEPPEGPGHRARGHRVRLPLPRLRHGPLRQRACTLC